MIADDNSSDASSDLEPMERTLRKLVRGWHHSAFGDVLITAAQDQETLHDLLRTNVLHLQQFVLCHVEHYEYADESVFVDFSKDTLTLGFDPTLQGLAVLYLCRTFNRSRNVDALRFLMSVMRAKVGADRKHLSEGDGRTARLIYGCLRISLDLESSLPEIDANTAITHDMLEELDRHIAEQGPGGSDLGPDATGT